MSSQRATGGLPLSTPARALALGVAGFLLELVLISPWVDRAADSNPTVHFTQHGLIFVGGVIMGWALRDLRLLTLLSGRR
jgi:hypothetical protein